MRADEPVRHRRHSASPDPTPGTVRTVIQARHLTLNVGKLDPVSGCFANRKTPCKTGTSWIFEARMSVRYRLFQPCTSQLRDCPIVPRPASIALQVPQKASRCERVAQSPTTVPLRIG